MYSLVRYYCGKCRREFADEKSALKCEEIHREPSETRAQRGTYYPGDVMGYPKQLEVTMDDGMVLHYALQEADCVVKDRKSDMDYQKSRRQVRIEV